MVALTGVEATRQRRNDPEENQMLVFVSIASGLGGSTRSLATVMGGLPEGVERVLCAPGSGTFLTFLRDRNLADAHIKIPKPASQHLRRLSRFVAAGRITRFVYRHRKRIAAIHANGLQEVNLVALAAFVSRVRTVMWIHDFEVYPWTLRFGRFIRRLLQNRPVVWLAVSPTARHMIVRARLANESDIELVTNPIDPKDVVGTNRVHSPVTRIGFVGAADRRKGFHLLPEIDRLLSDLPLRWEMFTSSPAEETDPVWSALRALPADRAVFNGKVADIRTAYARCDVVFCPSLKESFCRVAAEAMLNGIPVVASDIPPLRDLLGDNEAGRLFPVEDTSAAARCLRDLISNPHLRHLLGEKGIERAKVFDPAGVIGRLVESYGLRPQ